MYSNCYHCTADLGRNEAIEAFTTGTRLAFDPARGRLWVVCRKCARWNLSPLDTRWEAMEEAERRYRDSRLRVSTEHIGLARLREGLDLIRIGEPQRPEMAAWRYGDQFGRRRNRQLLITGAIMGSAAALAGGVVAIGAGITSLGSLWAHPGLLDNLINGRQSTVVGKIALEDGRLVTVQRRHARMSALVRTEGDEQLTLRLESKQGSYILTGDAARAATARIMPTVNRFGGTRKSVQDAVDVLEEIGDPARVLTALQQRHGRKGNYRVRSAEAKWNGVTITKLPGTLHSMKIQDRLALEMALHEEAERRVMNGELEQLERAWREAEEIAAISDDMFVSDSVESRLAGLRLVRNDNGDYSVVAVHSDDH